MKTALVDILSFGTVVDTRFMTILSRLLAVKPPYVGLYVYLKPIPDRSDTSQRGKLSVRPKGEQPLSLTGPHATTKSGGLISLSVIVNHGRRRYSN